MRRAAAVALKGEAAEVALAEATAVLAMVQDEDRRGRLADLIAAIEDGAVEGESAQALEELLELGLQTGRLRALYGPAGEQAALKTYRRLPGGKELAESAREVSQALSALAGLTLEQVSLSAVGRGRTRSISSSRGASFRSGSTARAPVSTASWPERLARLIRIASHRVSVLLMPLAAGKARLSTRWTSARIGVHSCRIQGGTAMKLLARAVRKRTLDVDWPQPRSALPPCLRSRRAPLRRARRRPSSRSSPTRRPPEPSARSSRRSRRPPAGKDVTFKQSYGASGPQAAAVHNGLPADVVNLSLAPDVTVLSQAGLVSTNWNKDKFGGMVTDSIVVFVVRKGNPKNIKTWADLIKPGIQVINPNPFTSGGARWNVMAAWGAQIKQHKTPKQANAYLGSLYKNITVQDSSARASMNTFVWGKGDVLLAYENEAIQAQQAGADIPFVRPSATILIENPIAVLKSTQNPTEAKGVRRVHPHRPRRRTSGPRTATARSSRASSTSGRRRSRCRSSCSRSATS